MMGWLRNSPNSDTASVTAQALESPESLDPLSPTPNNTPDRGSLQSSNEDSNPELRDILDSHQATPSSKPSSSNPNHAHGSEHLTSAHLYPTTISCRSTFDNAFYCQSVGGQFANVYRFGTLRSCSEQWSDFWWCMRTNRGWLSDDERAGRVQKRAWEREKRIRAGGCSEDIWEQRGRLVRGAFGGDWADLDCEMERARREKQQSLYGQAEG